jgi:hypothetical protein
VPAGVVVLLACEAWLAGGGGRRASGVQLPAWVLSIAVVPAAAMLGAVMAVLVTAIGVSRPRRRWGGTRPTPADAPWVVRALAVLLPIGFIALALGIADLEQHRRPLKPQAGNGPIQSGRPIARNRRPAGDAPVAGAWWWIAAGAGAAGLAGTALLLRPGAHHAQDLPKRRRTAATAKALEETATRLRDDPDPRRAILAAYARMERTFASIGLGRSPSEAPREYLRRIDEQAPGAGDAVQRLTGLYELARFAQAPATEPMRHEALAAVAEVRRTILPADA